MNLYSGFLHAMPGAQLHAHACNCVGPRNGDPVCPCMMPEHIRRKQADLALDILRRQTAKPRIRVKAGREVVA